MGDFHDIDTRHDERSLRSACISDCNRVACLYRQCLKSEWKFSGDHFELELDGPEWLYVDQPEPGTEYYASGTGRKLHGDRIKCVRKRICFYQRGFADGTVEPFGVLVNNFSVPGSNSQPLWLGDRYRYNLELDRSKWLHIDST
jgi:hypothetical protein